MYKEVPSHSNGTESRRRQGNFWKIRFSILPVRKAIPGRARGENSLRQPRCAREVGVEGSGGGNGGEAESGIGQGGRDRGGAPNMEVQSPPGAATGPCVPATGATLLSRPLGLRCGGGSCGG